MRVFVTGFMAAGKSTIGRLVARRLGAVFEDLDRSIEQAAGAKIPTIFRTCGEARFREIESGCLAQTARHPKVVVAMGGGALQSIENRQLMAELGLSVWLDPPIEVMLRRLIRSPVPRPLFQGVEQARQLFDSRRRWYQEADFRIVLTGRESHQQVVDLVVDRLEQNSRCAI